MHISFPLFLRILSDNHDVFSRVVIFLHRHKIHIPNANDEASELNITFELRANILVVFGEVS